jgi:hypothetical protein
MVGPAKAWRRWLGAVAAGLAAALALLWSLAALVHLDAGQPLTQSAAQRAKKPGKGQPKIASRLRFLPPVPRPVEAKKPDQPKTEEELLNGQVVETARPEREQAPKNAKYLGRYEGDQGDRPQDPGARSGASGDRQPV